MILRSNVLAPWGQGLPRVNLFHTAGWWLPWVRLIVPTFRVVGKHAHAWDKQNLSVGTAACCTLMCLEKISLPSTVSGTPLQITTHNFYILRNVALTSPPKGKHYYHKPWGGEVSPPLCCLTLAMPCVHNRYPHFISLRWCSRRGPAWNISIIQSSLCTTGRAVQVFFQGVRSPSTTSVFPWSQNLHNVAPAFDVNPSSTW